MLRIGFPPGAPILIGATRAESWLETALLQIGERRGEVIVLIDFDQVEAANASFIKASVLRLLHMGIGYRDSSESSGRAPGQKQFDVFPILVNCNEEIRLELHEVMVAQRLPITINTTKPEVLGWLEPALRDTWELLLARGGQGSASELAETSASIGHTAWANRLSELHRLRLVTRVREGKKWRYILTATTRHE